MNSPDLFIVMIDYGKIGCEAIVDPNDNWSDALAKVREARGDGKEIVYVRHVHDRVDEDRTQEALDATAPESPTLSAQNRTDWQRDHDRDARKHEVAA